MHLSAGAHRGVVGPGGERVLADGDGGRTLGKRIVAHRDRCHAAGRRVGADRRRVGSGRLRVEAIGRSQSAIGVGEGTGCRGAELEVSVGPEARRRREGAPFDGRERAGGR